MKRPVRLNNLAALGVDRMGALAASLNDPELLRMENIDTDLRPHSSVIQATRDALEFPESNSYLPLWGPDNVRQAVTARVSATCGVDYDWQTDSVITAGGWNALLNTIIATIDSGDGVILTDPAYAGITNRVKLVGGIPHLVPFVSGPDGWRLDLNALRETAAKPGMRAIILMNPSLPTGAVLTHEEWSIVAEVCRNHDLLLIYDAAHERVLFDDREVIHPASFPGMAERTLTIGSASKEYRMIGWRVGWVVGPPQLIADITFVGMTNVGPQVGIAMHAAYVALNTPDEDVQSAVAEWQRRRDLIMEELDGIVPVIQPHGGWTMMLDFGALGLSGEEASKRLLEKGKIVATAMQNWGADDTARYLRFVFSREPLERLQGIGERIKRSL